MSADIIKVVKILGGTPLKGEVSISGAKNSVTKLILASLLTSEPVTLHNVPNIGDVDITIEICSQLGTKVETDGHTLKLHTPEITNSRVREQTKTNRLSVLAISPLLHRAGEAELPIVGGDDIGVRPVNYHIDALRQMGANITETEGGYHANTDGLKGVHVELAYPSVGATENIILAGVLAKGRTVIHNAAIEPEVLELVLMLQKMGAIIEYRAKQVIIIEGVPKLHGTEHTVIPDRLEAASYAVCAIATNGEIFVRNARQTHLLTFLNALRKIGAEYEVGDDGILFKRGVAPLKATEITTDVWPGFATDWQQPLAVLLTQANGKSIINETVYERRFGYTKVLNAMGADIKVFNNQGDKKRFRGPFYQQSAEINGPTKLHSTNIAIPDIRAGMAHVIAALVAEGESTLSGVEHLYRGYETPVDKLKAVGANITTA